MDDSSYRLWQAQTNVLDGDDGWRVHAGDWIVQRINDQGEWRNYDGPYAPHEKSRAHARLMQLQEAELPQLFD